MRRKIIDKQEGVEEGKREALREERRRVYRNDL